MKRNPLEWGVLIVSVLAVVVLVGYLLVVALTGPTQGVMLTLRVDEAAPAPDGVTWQVPVAVTNEGDQAALGVVIEAVALVGTEEVSAELTVDLVPPGGSSVSLVFAFTGPPEADVTARVVGFERP
jgi:uncharacterized protein (TIGR02588 family)